MATIPVLDFDLKDKWARALELAGVKQEVLAGLMGITPSQLSMQLTDAGHPSLRRLLCQGVVNDPDGLRFVQYLWLEIAEEIGIEEEDALAAAVKAFARQVINGLQVRMAHAEIRGLEQQQQKRRA